LEGSDFFKAEMRRTLENLAADATTQAGYLKELGVGTRADELALEFDDISSRVWQAVEEGAANARLWSVAGLQSAEWGVVRRHARAVLDLYDADPSVPRGRDAASDLS
jgi:hypothetical protein